MRNSIKKLAKNRVTPFSGELYNHDAEGFQLADIRATPDDGHVAVVPLSPTFDEQDNIDRLLADTGFDRLLPGISAQDDTFATVEDIDIDEQETFPPEKDHAMARFNQPQESVEQTIADNRVFVEGPAKDKLAEESVHHAGIVTNKSATAAAMPTNNRLPQLIAWLAGASLTATVILALMVYEMKSELKQLNAQLNDGKVLTENGSGADGANNLAQPSKIDLP